MKSPGSDGFTAEFLNVFWVDIGKFVFRSINDAYEIGKMSVTQKQGVITCIPKEVTRNCCLSDCFRVERGCGQGDTLSPNLFLLCAEILGILVRNNNDIKGITIDDTEFILSQYADDTSLILDGSPSSLDASLRILQFYAEISGLKINLDKTNVIWIGKCPIGYTSTKGVACYQCQYPYYGNRCAYKCKCNFEFCNFKQGCGSFTRTKKLSTQRKGSANILKATATYTDRSPTNKPSGEKTGKEDDDKIVLYVGVVGLLVIAILIGMLLNGVKNKYCSRQIVPEQKVNNRHQPTEESLEMYSYEYIDEQQITDQNPFSVPPSLQVPRNGVQHQSDETSENNDSIDAKKVILAEDEGYLNPYQPIQVANIYKREYKSIGADSSTDKQADDYLHPYNSLLTHGMPESHEYKDLRNENIKLDLESSESNKFQTFV
ncbi:uncharacterized protein [Mytilus edulis]|uniref:uncharacterized protein n=1 Tax=Mytilus edulis TaxID=6550 RepID=UPI0039EF1ACC